MYIPTSLIPENDISITPKNIYNIIKELLDIEISFYDHNELFVNLLKSVKKNLLKKLENTNTWVRDVLSKKTCDHVFGENSKRFKDICGSRIDIKYNGNNFRCSKHIDINYEPKKHIIPENERCKGITIRKNQCNKKGLKKYNGNCKYHYQEIQIEELQEENKILNTEKNCKIYKNIVKQSVNIESLYNIINKLRNNEKIFENKRIDEKNNFEKLNIIDNLDIKENGSNLKEVTYGTIDKDEQIYNNMDIYELIFKTNIEINQLDNNINNFEEKIKLINKIINIKCCNYNGCKKNKYINIIEKKYCKDHENHLFNNYKNNNVNKRFTENISIKQLHQLHNSRSI